MANEYYITAGLPAIDSADILSVATNAYYITAGLVADDYVAAGGRTTKNTRSNALGMAHGMTFRQIQIQGHGQ